MSILRRQFKFIRARALQISSVNVGAGDGPVAYTEYLLINFDCRLGVKRSISAIELS